MYILDRSSSENSLHNASLSRFSSWAAILSCTLLISASSIHAQTPSPLAQDAPLFAPNQVIVQFEPSYAPHMLNPLIEEREALRSSFLGRLQLLVSDQISIMNGKALPEDVSATLSTVDNTVGALEKAPMFDVQGESQENTYLVSLDGSTPVLETVALYESLDAVTFAQPNYLYAPQN